MSAHEPPPESPLQSATAATATDTATATETTADAAAAPRFAPEEEATLLTESHSLKTQATALYAAKQYSQAVGGYDKALASCPTYLEYEVAVLKANIAACHLQQQEWKEAVEAATSAIEALERLLKVAGAPQKDEREKEEPRNEHEHEHGNGGPVVVELSGTDAETAEELKQLESRDQRHTDIQKLRAKALLRRAKAKCELSGWGNLQGAEDDYKTLLSSPSPSSPLLTHLSPPDIRTVKTALHTLPSRIQTCREQEMGEMMGKLKELGNGILKPFGLSTDMFQMKQDEGTGGWSVNVNQGR